MAKPKPLVAVATLCESVLTEADQVVSVIRMIDTVFVTRPPELPKEIALQLPLRIFVSLKSGEARGEYDIDLILRSPSGKTAQLPQKWHVSFVEDHSGANLHLNFMLPLTEFGLYWFDVVWEGEPLTRIPIKLVEGDKPGQADGTATQTAALR